MKYTKWLTFALSGLGAVQTIGGLTIPTLYRDVPLYRVVWQANDAITLLLLPFLIWTNAKMLRGNTRAHLAWVGLVLYLFYNYSFYLFGTEFNSFFLLYALLLTLSLYALVIGLIQLNITQVKQTFSKSPPRRVAAVFLLAIVMVLGIVEASECINFILYDKLPSIPKLILALDLSIVLPTSLLAALLLFYQNVWGDVLGVMMVIKSFTYGLVLIAGSTLAAVLGFSTLDPLISFYTFIASGGFALSWLFLKTSRPRKTLIQSI